MTVPGVCPSCGAKFPLDAALQDSRARQALAGALKIDARLADPLLAYLGLFSAPDRAARMDKLVRIITTLAEPIAAAKLEHNRRMWPAPVDYWREALEATLAQRDKLALPLNDHGYLFAVVAGIANRAGGAQERKVEQSKQNRENTKHDPEPAVDAAERALRSQVGRDKLKNAVKGTMG